MGGKEETERKGDSHHKPGGDGMAGMNEDKIIESGSHTFLQL